MWAGIGRVTFPTFSLLKNDTEKLVISFRKAIVLVAFVLFPTMFILAACSHNLVLFLYTAKWIKCAIYFKIFCFIGAFLVMDNLTNNVVAGSGRSGFSLFMNVFQKSLLLLSVFFSFRFGIVWMAIAYGITMIICFVVDFTIYCKIFKRPTYKEFSILFPYLFFGAASYFICILVGKAHLQILLQLFAQLFAGTSIYLFFNMTSKTKGFNEFIALTKPVMVRIIGDRRK
jgi:O-antigen/teichoic acid export membrane protein